MTASSPITPLCDAHNPSFWPWHRWPEFSRWPTPEAALVIVPMAGMADWGLGHAIDAEELVLMHVLRQALEAHPPAPQRVLVVPPLRFVFGPGEDTAFATDPPTIHQFLDEVVASIAASGFRRIVLYNSSPWNEELTAAAARDQRIARQLQMFRISLSGLGLDFDPTRAPDRRDLQTVITALSGRTPEDCDIANPTNVANASVEAPALLEPIVERLAQLVAEIDRWPALPDAGRIPAAVPPSPSSQP